MIKKMMKLLPILTLVLGGMFPYFTSPSVSAAGVRCFAATGESSFGNELNCSDPGVQRTLLDYANVSSLSQLNDRCFGLSIDWNEFSCSEVAGMNDAQCVKENVDQGRYSSVDCGQAGVNYNFQDQSCYAISATGTVREFDCTNTEYIGLSSGNYAGGRYSGADVDENNPIVSKVLKPVIRTLSAAVGLVIIISLIIAGIQYSAARDNAQMVAAAKSRILMAIVSLIIFIFGFAVLQWLVPNGII